MLDYLKEQVDKYRGRQVDQWRVKEAEDLLKHPLIQEFWQQYRVHLQSLWSSSTSPEEREELHRLFKTSEQFEKHLRSYLMFAELQEINGRRQP